MEALEIKPGMIPELLLIAPLLQWVEDIQTLPKDIYPLLVEADITMLMVPQPQLVVVVIIDASGVLSVVSGGICNDSFADYATSKWWI